MTGPVLDRRTRPPAPLPPRMRRPAHIGAPILRKPYRSKHQLRTQLWVAEDLDWFEAPAGEAIILGDQVEQPGADGVLRTYRRITSERWRQLIHDRGHGPLAVLRERMVACFGELSVLLSEGVEPPPELARID